MIHQGNSLTILKSLKSESIDCCVTSPPYWGLEIMDYLNHYGEEDLIVIMNGNLKFLKETQVKTQV